MKRIKFFILLALFTHAIRSQQRYLVSPNDEVIPLREGEDVAVIVQNILKEGNPGGSFVCTNKATFGYPATLYSSDVEFGNQHKDVMGMWFVPPASGTVDTMFGRDNQLPGNDQLLETQPIMVLIVVPASGYGTCFDDSVGQYGWNGTGDFVLSSSFTKLGSPYNGSSWVTNDSGTYSVSTVSSVLSPLFNLSALTQDVYISFFHSINTEPKWDFSQFEYSTNGGSSWNVVGTLNDPNGLNWYSSSLYNTPSGVDPSTCLDSSTWNGLVSMSVPTPIWSSKGNCSGIDTSAGPDGWIYTRLKFNTVAGDSSVQFRYFTFSDAGAGEDGWAFDCFRIEGANCFTGSPGGFWSVDSNWSSGHSPLPFDSVCIPTSVIVDSLPSDSIYGLGIGSSGELIFNAGIGPLTIAGNVTVDSGGTIQPDTNGMVVYGNWTNNGSFSAGTSNMTFAGNGVKVIGGSMPTTFYDLQISGANKSTEVNVNVTHNLTLNRTLNLRVQDTISISNSDTGAISDTGFIPKGTIQRAISGTATGKYRFESPYTYVQFDSGSYPTSVTMTTVPSGVPDSTYDYEDICSVNILDTLLNTVRCDSVRGFSKYVLGKPNVGLRIKKTLDNPDTLVNRKYFITSAGGGGFRTRLQLRYEDSEIPTMIAESELEILRFSLSSASCSPNQFTAAAGSWSDSLNWSAGHVPQPGDSVIIPGAVAVSSLPYDSICALSVLSGGTLTFSPGVGTLKIAGNVTIDTTGGTINLDNNQFTCYGDWSNNGTYNAGTSTVTLAGNSSKKIKGSSTSTFYNLRISGSNKSTETNINVSDSLVLQRSLDLRPQDTIYVSNSDTGAISDTGRIPEGTIFRAISATATGKYRFESPNTYIQFDSGSYPTSVTMTTVPSATPNPAYHYQRISNVSVLDMIQNTVRSDSVRGFSKYVLGKPNVGFLKRKSMDNPDTLVNRKYFITSTGGGGFRSSLQLRYEDSELPDSIMESELEILRRILGISVAMLDGWNIVSVPTTESNYSKSYLFPTSTSNAFRYQGGYILTDTLSNGPGYWLKFDSSQTITFNGGNISKLNITVKDKWNMIGSVSKPVATSSITSTPNGIVVSSYFGYGMSGYTFASSIEPGKGHWVKANGAGTLHLTSSGTVPKVLTPITDLTQFNWIVIQDASGHGQKLYLDTDDKVSIVIGEHEMPPPPPIGFDARFRSQRLVERYSQGDFKNGICEFPIDMQATFYPISVQWNFGSNDDLKFVLRDGVQGRIFHDIQMKGSGSYCITKTTLRTVVIRLVKNFNDVPKEFSLYQNYPNPFNPSTTINFDLPIDAFVTLKIYNILGQEIAVVASNKFFKAGRYSEGLNNENFVSGIYFYQMIAQGTDEFHQANTSFQSVKKMIVVR